MLRACVAAFLTVLLCAPVFAQSQAANGSIEGVVKDLDADPRGRMTVKVIPINNADLQQVQQVMTDTFQKNGTANNRNTATK